MKNIAKLATLLIVLPLNTASAAEIRSSHFEDTREYVIKSLLGKSPKEVLSAFNVKFKPSDIENTDWFGAWTPSYGSKKEHLRVFTLNFPEGKYTMKGRPITSMKAKFSKFKNAPNSAWKCWDAYYFCGPRLKDKKCICHSPNKRLAWCPVNGHLVSP